MPSLEIIKPVLLAVLAAVSLAILIVALDKYHNLTRQKEILAGIEKEIYRLEDIEDNKEVIERLTRISESARENDFFTPEISYRILNRKWRQGKSKFNQFRAARNNIYLRDSSKDMLRQLQADLFSLEDDCQDLLQKLDKSSVYAWKIHNLKGCINVVLAYTVLEFDQDQAKTKKFLQEAIKEFKTSTRLVDKVDSSAFESLLPRWNLELITGRGKIRQIATAYESVDKKELTRELETMLPEEMGGFAPGAPLETRVEK